MLDRWFHHRPIKSKLITTNLLATTSALLLVLVVMLCFEFFAVRSEIQQKLDVDARIIEENSIPALVFQDKQAAFQVLSSLKASPNISRAILFLPQGIEFSEYHAETAAPFSLPHMEKYRGVHFHLSYVHLYRDIILDGKVIGGLFIEARMSRFYDSMQMFILVIALAIMAALYLSFSLVNRLNLAIAHPLTALSNLMHHVSHGKDYSVRSEINSHDEIGDLARGFNSMLEQIQSRDAQLGSELDQRKQAEKHLNQLAYYDNVTQLPNRHYFKERLEQAVNSVQRYGGMCGLMFIDLDDFKIVNDTLGHHIGDELLQLVARCLGAALRTGDIVCRIGGDEFAVILENINDVEQTETVAQKIIDALSAPMVLEGKEVFIGASIGISICPNHASDMSTLLRNADAAMYRAKEQGKKCYQLYQPEMEYKALKRFTLENSLRRAIESNELVLYYQPQVDISSQRIVGAEALLRWQHPEMGMINPTDFIPIAEETGLIVPIGEWVLRNACEQGQKWQQHYMPSFMIGVNLSGRQLQLRDIVERILHIVAETGLPPHLLDIELTESTLMDNSDITIHKLEQLRDAGIRISIDDFGTGYSSISYLKRFPITTLKIDQSFIRDVPGDLDDVAITQAIIAMSSSLRMSVIAEGVESQIQLDFLQNNGCGRAQGFMLGKPMLAAELETRLQHQAAADHLVNPT